MSRQANGRSTIYQGKDGYWHGRVTVGLKDDGRVDRRHVMSRSKAVVVDKVSMQFVFGSEVDYVEGLQGAGFAVNNPNVVAACGCGSSFQVREDADEHASATA